MFAKPTYEMLEKRVAELEAQNSRLSKVQSELQRSLNFAESLLTALPAAIFYKDTEGRYQGCNGFIQKPFQTHVLDKKIRSILDSSKLVFSSLSGDQ